jgi:hypothetical protein
MSTRRTLTLDDVRALRAADGFHVWLDGESAELMLTKRNGRKPSRDPFDPPADREVSRRVRCNAGTTRTGSGGADYRPAPLRALALIVRPGDALVWCISENGNGYVRAARIPVGAFEDSPHDSYDALFVDELTVRVVRTGKDGRDKYVIDGLVMHYSVCPDNSARMTRPINKLPARD